MNLNNIRIPQEGNFPRYIHNSKNRLDQLENSARNQLDLVKSIIETIGTMEQKVRKNSKHISLVDKNFWVLDEECTDFQRDLEEKIEEMEDNIRDLEEKTEAIEDKITEEIEEKTRVLTEKTEEVENKIGVLEHKIRVLNEKTEATDNKIEFLEDKNRVIDDEIKELKAESERNKLLISEISNSQKQTDMKNAELVKTVNELRSLILSSKKPNQEQEKNSNSYFKIW